MRIVLTLLLASFLISCKRDDCAPTIGPFNYGAALLAPVKDTCYSVPCTSNLQCNYVTDRFCYVHPAFDPGNVNIIHAVITDTANPLSGTIRMYTINLLTNDTSSTTVQLGSVFMGYDTNGWFYFLKPHGNVWKCKTDGSQEQMITSDGKGYHLFVRSDGGELLLEDSLLNFADNNGHILRSFSTNKYVPNSVLMTISPDFSRMILFGYNDNQQYLVDTHTGAVISKFNFPADRLAISPDNTMIAGCRGNGALFIVYLDQLRQQWLRPDFCLSHQYWKVQFSPDNKHLITSWNENKYEISPGTIRIGAYVSIMDLDGGNEKRLKVD